MATPPDPDLLRSLVREILRDLVAPGSPAAAALAPVRVETVSIEDDADLAAFVQRLLTLFEDTQAREDIRAGRHVFRLNRRAPAATTPAAPEPLPERIDAGVLSEAKVIALAASRRRVVLGKRVAVTPLARDKARELGLKLERERR